jgi:ABC-type amino acid transport substrate-binding protein
MAGRRWRLAAFALLLAGVALAGCGGRPGPSGGARGAAVAPATSGRLTAAPGVVTAGTCPPDRPGLPLAPDRVEAFQAELLRRIGYKLALRVQVTALPGCDQATRLLAGRRLDLVATAPGDDPGAGLPQTEPYLVVQYALVVPASWPRTRDGLGALRAGARVGVLAGTAGARWARARLGKRRVAVAAFPDERAAAAAMAAGRCDALILPRAGAIQAARTDPEVRVDRLLDVGEQATILVAAANPMLGARVDSMLEQVVYDGSYATIFRRHFAATPVPVDFLPPD